MASKRRVQQRNLESSIKSAFQIGVEESEPFTVLGVQFVIRNLAEPEWADAISFEADELTDFQATSMLRYRLLAKALQEVNGFSLRELSSVEMDTTEEGEEPQVVEKETYLIQHLFPTWIGEVHEIVYAKFLDHSRWVESRAKDGIKFFTPQETPEQKFRALLTEARDLQNNIPYDLAKKILEDTGFVEIKVEGEIPPPVVDVPSPAPAPAPAVAPAPTRVPVTSRAVPIPEIASEVAPATPSSAPPSLPPIVATSRHREIAQMEGEMESELELVKVPPRDLNAALLPVDRGGINPRFSRPR